MYTERTNCCIVSSKKKRIAFDWDRRDRRRWSILQQGSRQKACLGQRLRCFSAENAEKSHQTLHFQRAYSSRMRRRNAGFVLGGKKSQKRARGRVALIPLALIAHAVPNNSEINLSSILEYSIMF